MKITLGFLLLRDELAGCFQNMLSLFLFLNSNSRSHHHLGFLFPSSVFTSSNPSYSPTSITYFCVFFFFPGFLGPHLRHMEVPRLGVESRDAAASLCHSHVRHEPHLWLTPQLTATQDPSPTERGLGMEPKSSWILTHNRNSSTACLIMLLSLLWSYEPRHQPAFAWTLLCIFLIFSFES